MKGTAAGIVAMLMWSMLGTLLAFSGDVPGLQLTAMTLFIGGVAMAAAQKISGEDMLSYWAQPLRKYLFVMGGICGYTALIYLSFKMITPMEANSLNYLWPVLLVLFATWAGRRAVGALQILGIIFGFCGALLLFLPHAGENWTGINAGHVLAAGGAVLWAAYSVMTKNVTFPPGFMVPVFFVSSLIVAVLHFLLEPTVWPTGWEWAVIMTLGIFRVSYSFWDYGMKHGDVIFLASLSYFIPLISTLLLILVGFGPENTVIGWGALFIVAGCLAVNMDGIRALIRRKGKTV